MIGLPAHTTHLLLPLDLGMMGPLKIMVGTIGRSKCLVQTDFTIKRADLPTVVKKAMDRAWTKHSFHDSGVYPFDPTAVDQTHVAPRPPPLHATVSSEARQVKQQCSRMCPCCCQRYLMAMIWLKWKKCARVPFFIKASVMTLTDLKKVT